MLAHGSGWVSGDGGRNRHRSKFAGGHDDLPQVRRLPHGSRYSAEVLLQCLRAALHLRSTATLHQCVSLGIEARWPRFFGPSVHKHPKSSSSSVQRSKLVVDLALILRQRPSDETSPVYRFVWSDGTDIKGWQMLISRHVHVRKDSIWNAMLAVHKLTLDCGHIEAALLTDTRRARLRELGMDSDDDDDENSESELQPGSLVEDLPEPLLPEERVRLCKVLLNLVKVHVQIPTALALGHTDLPSKVDAMMHACSLEAGSVHVLQEMVNSFCSITTDMGTELGMAEFRCASVESLMPEWHPERSHPRIFVDDTGDAVEPVEDPDAAASPFLFHYALGIPGMNHICSNLAKDVDEKLGGWDDFYAQLKNVAAFLSDDQRRRRIWNFCLKGTAFDYAEKSFLADVEPLYEKRWNMVILFLQRVRPLLSILRSTWVRASYETGMEHDDTGRVSLDEFAKTLASNYWFAYADMLLHLHSVLDKVLAWCEGCSCHEPLLVGHHRSQRTTALRNEYGGLQAVSSCVMAGLRADECADGGLSAVFRRKSEESERNLLASFEASLSSEEVWLVSFARLCE